jgi:hypothetical protein
MKYRLAGIIMAAVLLGISVWFASKETGEEKARRVHQHLDFRMEAGCDCEGEELCSHLPLVVIDTRGQELPGQVTGKWDRFGQSLYTKAADGDSVIAGDFSVIFNEERNNHLGDVPDIKTDCELRIRGNSSRHFPKKSYAIKLVEKDGTGKKVPVMGMGAHQDWVLNGPILDKSLVRNYMWYNISGEVMDYAPNVRFCEVILNGRYEGLYLMVESITDGEDCRLNLTMKVKNSRESGYLLRIDRPTEENLESVRDIYTFNERMCNLSEDVMIRFPGPSKLTPKLAKEIELDYGAFEKSLFSFDFDTKEYGYWNWIDVGNFVDYFLINEFTKNLDAGSYSTYIYKEVGEKYRLCVWDFNNACDNYIETETPAEGFFLYQYMWFFMLCKDENFVEQVIKRYEELRDGWLEEDFLMDYIDGTLEYLGSAVDRNNERWALEITEWNELELLERNLHSHEEAVGQLKGWLKRRGRWMDDNLHTLRKFSHFSRNKVYHH